jgi:hypothetical protein
LDYLFEFGERQDVRNLVGSAIERPSVHGVILDLHWAWLLGWQAAQFLDGEPLEDFNNVLRGIMDKPWFEVGPYLSQRWLTLPSLSGSLIRRGWFPPPVYRTRLDPSAAPSPWSDIFGDREPFVVRILLRPTAAQSDDAGLVQEYPQLFVSLEPRPVAQAYAYKGTERPLIGGVSVGADGSGAGTLGGLVQTMLNRRLAITCSHVTTLGDQVRQPAPSDDGSAGRIGTVIAAGPLDASNVICNPYDQLRGNLDIAAIELDADVASLNHIRLIGQVGRISTRTDIHPGEGVQVVGRSSGLRRLVVGGLGKSVLINLNGVPHCYKDVVELRKRRWLAGWPLVGRPAVKPGDSGAWVVRDGTQGPEWCAMVVGGERDIGYAILADKAVDWLRSQGIEEIRV